MSKRTQPGQFVDVDEELFSNGAKSKYLYVSTSHSTTNTGLHIVGKCTGEDRVVGKSKKSS